MRQMKHTPDTLTLSHRHRHIDIQTHMHTYIHATCTDSFRQNLVI